MKLLLLLFVRYVFESDCDELSDILLSSLTGSRAQKMDSRASKRTG